MFMYYCPYRAAKFRPMLGAQGLWTGRDLYRVILAVTCGLGLLKTYSNLDPQAVASYDTPGDAEDLFLLESSRI
jgi:hypothetical protein